MYVLVSILVRYVANFSNTYEYVQQGSLTFWGVFFILDSCYVMKLYNFQGKISLPKSDIQGSVHSLVPRLSSWYEPCMYWMADWCTIALFKAGTAEYRSVRTAYFKEMFTAETGERGATKTNHVLTFNRMNRDEQFTDMCILYMSVHCMYVVC